MADDILGLSPLEAIIKSIQNKMGLLPKDEQEELAARVNKELEKEKEKMKDGEEFNPETSWKDLFGIGNKETGMLIVAMGLLIFLALKD